MEAGNSFSNITVPSGKSKRFKNLGICKKVQCLKQIPKRLPPLRLPTAKDEDIWEVKALPVNWTPITKKSGVVKKLEKKRREQHNLIIAEIDHAFSNINKDAENELRTNAEQIKNDFTSTGEAVENLVMTINVTEDEQLILLTRDQFESISKNIVALYDEYYEQLFKFDNFLRDLEKPRTESIKGVLKQAYQKFHQISYKLPFEIQQYFEAKILEINQMLLNNLRCYEELKLKLHLQAENRCRVQIQEVDLVKFKWRELKKREALKQLTERKLVKSNCEAMMLQTERGKEASHQFANKELTMGKAWANTITSFPVTSENVMEWTSEMDVIVNDLDSYAQSLIRLYKLAIVKVFDKYFEDLQDLTDGMIKTGLLEPTEAIPISTEVCKPTIDTVTQNYSNEIGHLQNLWNNIFSNLKEKLRSTYTFLHAAAHLWDSHFLREQEAKRVILVDLKNLIKKNNSISKSQEIQVNIALDLLRQAPTVEKLEEYLDNVNRLLDSRITMYRNQFSSEAKVVDNTKLMTVELEVLLAELDLFLNKYEDELDDVNPTIQKQRASQCENFDIENFRSIVLPAQMKQCEFQVDAVQNWMFGLFEAIRKYSLTCREEVMENVSKWTTEHSERIGKRYELKYAFHSSRYLRLKENVYKIRLFEITKHANRIQRHKAGAESEINVVKQSYAFYETKYNNKINEFKHKLELIDAKRKLAKRSDKLQSYLREIAYITKIYQNEFDLESQIQNNLYETQLSRIRNTSVKCTQKVTLFIEGGNFNYDEAKKMIKDLKKFDKVIIKKFKIVVKDIQTKQKKIFLQVDDLEANIQKTVQNELEELEFTEGSVKLIKDIQVLLRTEVYNAKFIIKKLEGIFKYIQNKHSKCVGKNEFLDDFEYDFNGIVSFLLEAHGDLFQTPPAINASSRDYRDIENLAKNLTGSPKNYLQLLFDRVPIKNTTFMSKVCYGLYSSFQEIQTNAKEFYSKHVNIENKDLVQPNYDDFMKEVLQKYIFYHLQTELVWLNHVNDFLSIIESLRNFFIYYYKKFTNTHYNMHCDLFVEKHNELLSKFDEIKLNNLSRIHEIMSQLKPLHGCPSNKHLLQALENEVEEIMENVRVMDIAELIEPYEENRLIAIEMYNQELEEIDNRLAPLFKNSFGKLLNISLIKQFEDKLNYLIALKASITEEEGTECESYYHSQIREVLIPPEFEPNIEKFKEFQKTELLDSFQTDNCGLFGLIRPNFLIQKFQDEYDCQKSYITMIQTTFYDDYEKSHKTFNDNIKKISNLYSVKYKNKE